MKKNSALKIQEYIMERNSVSMTELCTEFSISINTVRRILQPLINTGILYKTYGGVAFNPQGASAPTAFASLPNYLQEKKNICKAASAFIEEGDIVFIDSGTTTPWLLDYVGDKSFTVITSNLCVLVRASKLQNVRLLSLPGVYMPSSDSFAGTETQEALSRYNITKAFMAAWGFSLEHGATVVSPWEYEQKKVVVEKASEVFLLINSAKFDAVTMLTFCQPDNIDIVITEQVPTKKFTDFFEKKAIKLITPN